MTGASPNGEARVRADFAEYRRWLESRWEIRLNDEDAAFEPTHDPARPGPPPAERFGLEEEVDRSAGLASDHVTGMMARVLERRRDQIRGRDVWEVGCGTALLATLAGKLGARRVRATDVDRKVIGLAERTAARNGVRIETAVASLFDGVPWKEKVEVLVADLPQKPVHGGTLPLAQDGGPEGTGLLVPFLEQSREWLIADGRLFFFIHSLTSPEALRLLHRLYRARVLAFLRRIFDPATYSGILPHLQQRREAGLSYFEDRPDGRHAFFGMVFEGT